MAIITTHTLNGTDGTHAAGISVSLRTVNGQAEIAKGYTDAGGRLSFDVSTNALDPSERYELVFGISEFWSKQGVLEGDVIPEIVLRFDMPDTSGTYHMPIILSPYSYSMWKSG